MKWTERLSRWLCKHGMHDWVYTKMTPIFPECGGAVACQYERHCGVCGKEESGSDWF